MKTMIDQFRVVSVSENTNSFGLRQMILMSRSGVAYKVCSNHLNVKRMGQVIDVSVNRFGSYDWASLGFELPEKAVRQPPPEVLKEVWENVKLTDLP